MKKKIVSIVLCVILAFTAVSPAIAYESSVKLITSSVRGRRSEMVDVSVSVSANSRMQACEFQLSYNSDSLELISAVKGDALTTSPIINPNKLGLVSFSYASTSVLTRSGSLLDLTFRIRDDAQYGLSDLIIDVREFSDGDFQAIDVSVINGQVTVVAPKLSAPTGLTLLSANATSANLFWDMVEGCTGYNVYLNGEKITNDPVSDNQIVLNDLMSNTEYSVFVSAMNYETESDYGSEMTFRTEKTKYQVMFVDMYFDSLSADSSDHILSFFEVDENASVAAPEAPEVEGYQFIGWDQDFSVIQSDMIIKAVYEKLQYHVTFLDWNGVILNEQTVNSGEAAVLPEDPQRDGYTFIGWDKPTNAITSNIVVQALYEEIIDVPVDAPTITVHPLKTKVRAGESVQVELLIKNNPGVAGIVASPVYDSAMLTLESSENGTLFDTFRATRNLIWSDTSGEDILTDGVLATLSFKVSEDAETGTYPIQIVVRECTNAALDDIELYTENADISVIDIIYGDANGDGKVTIKDIVLLNQYLANYDYDTETSTVSIEPGADANGDGRVTIKDIVLLNQYLANYDYDTETSTVELGPKN